MPNFLFFEIFLGEHIKFLFLEIFYKFLIY